MMYVISYSSFTGTHIQKSAKPEIPVVSKILKHFESNSYSVLSLQVSRKIWLIKDIALRVRLQEKTKVKNMQNCHH